jgi:uncharacterized protein YdeI (YjbR/CyaY-like superfamily)
MLMTLALSAMVKASDERETFQPNDRADWRRWLEENHARSTGIWLVICKKAAPRRNLSLDEAVEEALAFGWIDSRLNRIDEERFKIIMSPRRPGSIWSKKNKRRVGMLIEKGLMAPAGMARMETAKRDGTWNMLDEVEGLVIPPDLSARLDDDPEAKRNFHDLSPTLKMQCLLRIAQARRAETRARRIDDVVRRMGEGGQDTLPRE